MRHTSGYTLIEILVALAIIATAVAAVVAGVSGYVNNAAYLRDRTVAQWVVSNKIAEMQLATEWPSPGKRRGGVSSWRDSRRHRRGPTEIGAGIGQCGLAAHVGIGRDVAAQHVRIVCCGDVHLPRLFVFCFVVFVAL